MPIQAQLDTGYAGQAAPLEGADEGKMAGITATAMGSFIKSPVIGLAYKGMEAAAGGTMIPQKDAQEKMKAQGYDASVIPATGITSGALDVLMNRQSDIRVNESIASRANLSGTTRFVASIAGGLPDPSNVALMAFAPELKIGELGLAGRAAAGAAEGGGLTAGYVYGSEAVNHSLGDKDASTMSNLRTVLFGSVIGGGLHAGFGGKAPEVKQADMRDTIFTAVQKAEDATGKGIITTDTGGLTKFGISQHAHPDVDIKNLTQEGAAKIIKTDYWDKIDGDHLSSDIAHTALDAAVNQGVANAKKWMLDSGGDVQRFNAYREAEYRRLAAENPEKYGQYLPGWLNRLKNVKDEPILAAGEAPRIKSVDQMGANVDELPAETRNAAGEAAVNQFLRDDEVNVDTVINKSLEEQYGVKPNTDFDPTGEAAEAWGLRMSRDGENGPRSALTLADEHEDWVNSLTTEGYRDASPRRFQGEDADLAKAVPVPNRGIVSANDNARIAKVKDAVESQKALAVKSESDGPLTAAAKASTAEAVQEAKAMFTHVRGPYVEDPKLTPAQNAAAKIEHEAPLEAFKEHMTLMDAVAKDHEMSADAVEAAVRCAMQLGED